MNKKYRTEEQGIQSRRTVEQGWKNRRRKQTSIIGLLVTGCCYSFNIFDLKGLIPNS